MRTDRTDLAPRSFPRQAKASVYPFPLALNRKLVERLVDRFLAIPPSDERANLFRRRELGPLKKKRLRQGIPLELVALELKAVEQAIAVRLAAIFSEEGSKA
ncbi:DUF6074 family protein [Microvirga sp. CF3016]|uniref:DUF6074 family protein n=1 Tax=Microvirga sp. CF3016 TaxID=3110181 RepID=UPI002E79BCAC|nr:DUF6074 family protein [Microvirga sp. CF3016]MEE1611113.1 DUF6074 family protein [Microvirga sp. CF3016]